MVVISMVPFFSVMTLTILLERLQLLQTASIRDRARGSFLWQHAVIATLRFLTFPRARFWTSSTQNIASAFKPTDFTQRRTNQSSLFQSTPRRPASSVWETFPLHKFMGSARLGTTGCAQSSHHSWQSVFIPYNGRYLRKPPCAVRGWSCKQCRRHAW